MSPLHETVRLSVELDVAVEDRVAAASFLLAAVRDPQGGMSLPAASTLDRQVGQIVDEAIRDCLRAEQGVTGLRIDALRIRAVAGEPQE